MVVIHVEGKKIKGNTARLTLIRPHISHIKTLVIKKKDKRKLVKKILKNIPLRKLPPPPLISTTSTATPVLTRESENKPHTIIGTI